MFKNKTYLITVGFYIFNLSLHIVADFNSGFQGGELLHISTGNHLAWGYMEFPLMIGWRLFRTHSTPIRFLSIIFSATLLQL